MYDLTVVSGADTTYFKYLSRLINNINKYRDKDSHKHLNINLVIYDLGLNNVEVEVIKNKNNIIYEKFNFDLYPEHVSINKYGNGTGIDNNKNRSCNYSCSYAWKPIIIHQVCMKYGGLVFWSDTRNIHKGFKDLITIIKNNYIYSPSVGIKIKKFCHPTTKNLLNADSFLDKNDRSGGIFGVNYNIPWCRDLVTEWKVLSLIKECIVPDGSNRNNHRQDQTILSILYWRYQNKYNFTVSDKWIRLTSWND